MVKEKDSKQKQNKKAPAKNLKEKRAAKAAKRAAFKSDFLRFECTAVVTQLISEKNEISFYWYIPTPGMRHWYLYE